MTALTLDDVTHHVGDRRNCAGCGARVFTWATDGVHTYCRNCVRGGHTTPRKAL